MAVPVDSKGMNMGHAGWKRVAFVMGAIALLLLFCLCYLGFLYNRERMEARAAWSVMADYERTREKLNQNGIEESIAFLDVVAHANSNLKNRHLNLILAKERMRIVTEVMDNLRRKTGDDLGDDPEKWIAKYRKKSAGQPW